jgi:hypothetical protein
MDSTAILVEAERKFMIKLCNAMTPVMIDSFYEMYKKAIEVSKGRQTLIHYQTLLQEVPHWNNTIVKQHADAIIKSCSMFPNLLAAVFVISVKIMSAVRISSDSKKINIKLPSNDVFVHSCYIAVAKSLYEDPYVIVDKMSDQDRRIKMGARFSELIKEVVDDFIPVQQILDTYIPNFTGDLDMGGTNEDPTDPADPEMEEESTPVATPLPDAGDAGTPAAPEEAGTPAPEAGTPAPEAGTPMREEFPEPGRPGLPPAVKYVPVKVHNETLFDDAPDK